MQMSRDVELVGAGEYLAFELVYPVLAENGYLLAYPEQGSTSTKLLGLCIEGRKTRKATKPNRSSPHLMPNRSQNLNGET